LRFITNLTLIAMLSSQDNLKHHSLLHYAIRASKINPAALIPIVEDIINMEHTNLQANKRLHNEEARLANEYRITHAEILLSLLRRDGDA